MGRRGRREEEEEEEVVEEEEEEEEEEVDRLLAKLATLIFHAWLEKRRMLDYFIL